MKVLRRFITSLLDIIYPSVCIVCKGSLKARASIDGFVCLKCWVKIKKNTPPFCHFCGRHLTAKNSIKHICSGCTKGRLHFDRAYSPCLYDGVIKDLIHEFKYKARDYLGLTLSRPMTEFIDEYNLPIGEIDFIIPVPLHKRRLREREFNQAEVLSRHIARKFNKTVLNASLKRIRHTRTQTELKENQRLLNVKGSFSVAGKESLKGKNILLVDDVLTTGATASEAARALKDAGAGIVFVLTAAN